MKREKFAKRKKTGLRGMRELEEVLENFKVLVNNLIPLNPEQAEWICNEIERLSKDYPALKSSDVVGNIDKPFYPLISTKEQKNKRCGRTKSIRKRGVSQNLSR